MNFMDKNTAPAKSVITCPELQVYIDDFGNSKHDKALLAEVDGNIVGTIWARIMNDYGHIDADTPSLAMSVHKAYRGMGIGTLLLTQMLLAEKTAEEYIMAADLNSIYKTEEENGF